MLMIMIHQVGRWLMQIMKSYHFEIKSSLYKHKSKNESYFFLDQTKKIQKLYQLLK